MSPREQDSGNKKPAVVDWLLAIREALRRHWLLTGLSLALGMCAGLAASSRLPGFWILSRLPRLAVILVSGLLLAGLAAALIRQTWRLVLAPRRWIRGAGLGAAVLVGTAVYLSGAVQLSLPPLYYRLEIESPAGQSAENNQVHLVEIGAPSGRALEADQVQVEGGWQRSGLRGFVTAGSGPGRLYHIFYDQPGKKLRLLFEEQPASSQVLIRLDQQEQRVDLTGVLRGMRQVELTLPRKAGRWEAFLYGADLVTWSAVLPMLLFVAGAYCIPRAASLRPAAAAWFSRLVSFYPGLFVAGFIGLLLLPLAGFPGSLAKFEREFYGSAQLLWAYSALRERVLHDVDFYEVLRGRDGWLIYSSAASMDDFQNTAPFSAGELEQIRQKLDGLNEKLDRAGIPFLVYVVPNKNTIYPDYVPAQIPVIGPQSRLDQVIAYQKQHGQAQILDLRPALQEARRELDPQGRTVYLKTDTHWSMFGALAGYQQVMTALQDRFPAQAPMQLSDFLVPPGNKVLGDMGNNWIPAAEPEEWIGLERNFPARWKRYNLSDETPVRVATYQSGPGLPKAVFYHDSSMIWQYEFFAAHFGEAQFIWSYDIDLDYVVGEEADIVLLEITERFLPSLLKNGTAVDE